MADCLIVGLASSTGFCHVVTVTLTLRDKLRAKQFVITAEVTPPVSADRDELLAKALPLRGLADAVNVTDGAGARPPLRPGPHPHPLAERPAWRRRHRRAQPFGAARRRSVRRRPA